MSSEEFFRRNLDSSLTTLSVLVDRLIMAHLGGSADDRTRAHGDLSTQLDAIFALLVETDRPGWLRNLKSQVDRLGASFGNQQTQIKCVKTIATSIVPSMVNHKWNVGDTSFDFDAIFESARNQNDIPGLFDEIVIILDEIVSSGKIDSVRALRDLERVIATLRKSRTGSYLATRSAWDFLKSWIKNTGWEALGDIPILGAPVRGLRDTVNDGDGRMTKIHQEITINVQSEFAAFPSLTFETVQIPDPPRIAGPNQSLDTDSGE